MQPSLFELRRARKDKAAPAKRRRDEGARAWNQARPLAHVRQLKSLGSSGEDFVPKDSMKVAQYEVLGNDAKRHVRPARDDRNIGFESRMRLSDCQHSSIVPFLLRPAAASLWRGLLFAGAP